jgi:hypothetical protein
VNLNGVKEACLAAIAEARWERDSAATLDDEIRLLAAAAYSVNNTAFLHALGSLQRVFEQLPAAWLEARPLAAVARRMSRTLDLLECRSGEQLYRLTLDELAIEDAASLAALKSRPK